MARNVFDKDGTSYKVASSHLITTCATLAAILLFVIIGANVVPSAIGSKVTSTNALVAAFLLNIAIVLFGYRRSRDLSETLATLKQAEADAFANAYTDHTTGLPNRRALLGEIEGAFAAPEREGALLLIDVDNFKRVNDLYGHVAGDQLLRMVGEELVRTLPSSAFVARLGGDEFAALIRDEKDAESSARNAVRAFGQPMGVGETKAQISISAGIVPLRSEAAPVDALRRADVAMYSVKQSGRNNFAWFDCQMEQQLQARVDMEDEIRAALEADEFVPFFQPLISLDTGELNGFEVLARWNSPRRGLIEPTDFIGIAEQSGQIGPLSMRVMEKAFVQARDWPAHLKLAVNVSPVQFRDPQLAERIILILTETGFPARRLEVEITEGSLLEDRAQALTILESLRNHGIAIALDDFGTGYASLSQLHALPFDRIKIDRSFINSLGESEQAAAIVQTIASLGKTLSVPITAEGVESDHIRQQMAALGCTDAQGFHFGRAVSAHVASMHFDAPKIAPSAKFESKRTPLSEPLNLPDEDDGSARKPAAGQKW
ncbi:EAL domain-containing protein [Sphingomonas sp. RB56-2]|uniref:EAL domain-containing protein n=1 Tax=Sphingomonas brevis TaxID=2908206 RepID=A0ABT0S975_9SPHN|nr:EAL domain-containing protein [Sphingomonas brevis]MCL6740966.1 EAL domain-containing protein [Sphingomonas brevis]